MGDMQSMFLDHYESTFPSTPVFIGEYHSPKFDVEKDLQDIFELVAASPVFLGISFFQYQVAYRKGGPEMDFGMFGLGDEVVAHMEYFGTSFDVYCLKPQTSPLTATNLPAVLAAAYGGSEIDASALCHRASTTTATSTTTVTLPTTTSVTPQMRRSTTMPLEPIALPTQAPSQDDGEGS